MTEQLNARRNGWIRLLQKTNENGILVGEDLGFYDGSYPDVHGRICIKCGQTTRGWADYTNSPNPLWISECCGAIHQMHGRPNPDTLND